MRLRIARIPLVWGALPFVGVIQGFDTIPAAWGCVERIATLMCLAA